MWATRTVEGDDGHGTRAKHRRLSRQKQRDADENSSHGGGEIFNGICIPPELPPIAEQTAGSSRMVIAEIVVNNFKSYYGRVAVGPFHKSLTSIVGCNGSGKSNIIDSLLFVFGYRSSTIRSKNISALLHKSNEHKNVCQCSVTVNFVNIQDDDAQNNGFVTVPGSEITITRTAFKDNTSFYTLNNKRVMFKDIATVLKKNGIDLIHNRFMIFQGEVENIAMMKPKAKDEHSTGLLEYLEDVIGTVRYKDSLCKLEKKLKDIGLEKKEQISRLKLLSKEREEIMQPVTSLIRVLKLDNQRILWDNKYQQKILFDENKIIENEKEKCKEFEDTINIINNECQAIENSNKNLNREIEILSEKIKWNTKEKENFEKKLKNLTQNKSQLKYDIIQANDEIKKNENFIQQEQSKITAAKGIPKVKEDERERLKSQLAHFENECERLETNYTEINSIGFEKSKGIREERDLLAPKELKWQNLVESKQIQLQILKTEFEVLLDTEKSEREKLNKLEEQLIKEIAEFKENARQKEKAELSVSVSQGEIKGMERNIENLMSVEKQIKTNLQNVRQSLTEKKTTYAETTERTRPIQYVLSLKYKGEICGILGRCGDYGQVESKFDIPACTACSSVDHIVVETTNAAHACIEKLRTNNIGRLTFSILPQVQRLKSRADSHNNYPENVKRVFDFIQILDRRFRLTFYSGLYDTLLAENLEQARRIAFGTKVRYRIVTFKGDLIDQSGIMSGGGRPIKGKIGPQETGSKYASSHLCQMSQNEVEKLDKIAKDLEVKLKETQLNIFDFQISIEKYHRQIEELNIIIKQCSLRANTWKEKENRFRNLIETQKLLIIKKKTDPIAVSDKEKKIKIAEKELEGAIEEFNKIKSKVDSLNKQIKNITDVGPIEAKSLLNEAVTKLEKTRIGINQVDIDIHAAEKQIRNSECRIERFKHNIDELKKEIESLDEKSNKTEGSIVKLQEKVIAITTSIVEEKKNIHEMENKKRENLLRSNELRKDRIPLRQNFDEIKNKIAINEAKCNVVKDKLRGFKLHEIPKLNFKQRNPVMECYWDLNPDETVVGENSSEKADPNLICDKVLCQYSNEELESCSKADIVEKLVLYSKRLESENLDFKMLEEYSKIIKRYNAKADDVTSVLKKYNDFTDTLLKVQQRRKDEFMASFKKIAYKLKETYQILTRGGDAELELIDSVDPFSEGVNFTVRPPNKTWKVISNLSGGEKTLSSLALVFTLNYFKPSPLYVMDEIDAALDSRNVSIIAYYLKEYTNTSQFIVISLRSNMVEKANLLVGIFKKNDCTSTVSINASSYKNMLAGALTEIRRK